MIALPFMTSLAMDLLIFDATKIRQSDHLKSHVYTKDRSKQVNLYLNLNHRVSPISYNIESNTVHKTLS